MRIDRTVSFSFDLSLSEKEALGFVRDAQLSLSRASFIENLRVERGVVTSICAELPVNAAFFGQRRLAFRSLIEETADGAKLTSQALADRHPGWAEVAGAARVTPLVCGTRVDYAFEISVHLQLPASEKWGGRALVRLIEFTTTRVLEGLSEKFPEAVREAAHSLEDAHAAAYRSV
ncbi:MAG: DUF3809 family protein [Trueperaceae bacterium]|nr:MAG: DUF3809 family protein [Trueperaceae bacterium]